MKRNPPSVGFDYLAEGASAKVYTNKTKVEYLVNCYKSKKGVSDCDFSREVVIFAKKLLPLEYGKHLPEIKRERIDENENKVSHDLVYSADFMEDIKSKSQIKIDKKTFDVISNTLLSIAFLIYEYFGYRDYSQFIYAEESDCLSCCLDINLQMTANWSVYNGILIARDPLVCNANGGDVIKLFKLGESGRLKFYYNNGKIVLDDGIVKVTNLDIVTNCALKAFDRLEENTKLEIAEYQKIVKNLTNIRWNFTTDSFLARYLKSGLI